MPGSSSAVACARSARVRSHRPPSPPPLRRRRAAAPARSRALAVIEKNPPQHGEKPYEQLVADAFDGPVLRLSQKMKLLEEADNRKIRRGDALDLIAATQRSSRRSTRSKQPPGRLEIFVKQYAIFAAAMSRSR